ncbi:site-specific tyrosine recombinase/integron integrase [Patescibacteria group bacterium]
MEKLLKITENELRLRNYSKKTIKTYLANIKKYLLFSKKKKIKTKEEALTKYLLGLNKKGRSSSTINLALNAVKFFYRDVLKSKDQINIKYAKRPSKLPVVLSKIEINKMIASVKNQKHNILISLAYGSGLRVGEVINLRVSDVNIDELTIHIKQTKGNKDRITVLPKKLKIELEHLLAEKDKHDYLFESERGGKLTTRTAQKVFSDALKRAKIQKEASFHCLRHSFATHLLENGVDIRYVQELLGHKNIRTTQRYTQVTNPKLKNIKSPL